MKENSNNTNKLTNSILPVETGFVVAKDYFDSIEDSLSLNLIEESLPNNEGFTVPENYFNTIDDRIILKGRKTSKGKLINLKKPFKFLIPVAASITVFLFAGIYFSSTEMIEISREEATLWFDTNSNSISKDEIIAIYEDINFNDVDLFEDVINEKNLEMYININDAYLLLQDISINETN
jgi:hypothetical protein